MTTELPRIAIAGIAIESSTFSPHRATMDDFLTQRGAELLDRYPFLGAEDELRTRAEWVPILRATSLPGGAVTPETYESLTEEILSGLREAGPLDGLFFDIHGAMSVVGRTDVEADLIERIRAVIGSDVLVSASMDLHGNVSRRLASALDLLTAYRKAPHTDAWQTRERAVRNLLDRLADGGKPLMSWTQVPVLLPGEKTSTRIEPAKSVYARIDEIEQLPGVLDAALLVGYAWADEPRCQASVIVTGDDEAVITEQTRLLAEAYWQARAEFAFVAPAEGLERCLETAAASTARPYFISDSGDNPTAGGAGDVSATLATLLATPSVVDSPNGTIYAAITDPDAVAAAVAAGVGETVTVEIGGRIDTIHPPVRMTARVAAIDAEDPVAGTAVVFADRGLRVIVTARRKPYHLESDFTALGLDPRSADLVVVKIGYLEPELYAMAADWMLALTKGGVDQDLLRLGHRAIERPMFPFDESMPEPALDPELL
ncbi:M81 family metallopeptidase [Sciscionella sediminilitoris]|uniref:M81 family metallopeptidase n=1 Tax=Sciscionella sediminilitoris TaxID=1445613 RepID=UPI0004DF6496|nr:M81 family metallopeptidase [Sciscionella sp. SE31]